MVLIVVDLPTPLTPNSSRILSELSSHPRAPARRRSRHR
jgi:hypothetical protein